MDANQINNSILAGQLDDQLEFIGSTIKYRQQMLRDAQVAEARNSLAAGDKVVLSNLRPKYINGSIATVVAINRTRAVVCLDEPRDRFRGNVTVPLSCITLVTS